MTVQGPYPLPEDPAPAEVARALRDTGHWGWVVDDRWHTVYATDELRLTFGAGVELAPTGARPRKAVRTGVESLTPSALRVAQMAADGMTNREIAQALTVTTKTVETHLRHVYQKLDIARRTDLPDALA